MAEKEAIRLDYSPGWTALGGFLAMVTFLAALIETAFLYPLLFPTTNLTAKSLWAGLLFPIPLWFLTHQGALLILRLLLLPIGVPGKFVMSQEGVSLESRKQKTSLRWAEIQSLRTGAQSIDWDAVPTSEPAAQGVAKAAASLAAKDWTLTFLGSDKSEISVSSVGFSRPVRRAEPKIRAWLQTRLQKPIAPLSETQRHDLTA